MLVRCLDVDLSIAVLVSVGLLLHDVKHAGGGGGLRGAFQSTSAWVPTLVAVALCGGCRAMRRRRCVSTVASTTNATQTTGDGICYGPQFPVGGVPVGGVPRVVVHVVVSSSVYQL